MMHSIYAIIATFAPLLCAIVSGFFLVNKSPRLTHICTISGMSVSFLCSIGLFFKAYTGSVLDFEITNFISYLNSYWALYIDPVTAILYLVVSLVSLLVHIYSIGYMAKDDCQSKFMSYLSLFTFSMLLLISSRDLVQLFVGWEGVGLCSYLLIGFWHKKESANQAAIKAFLVNRIGDIALIISICMIYNSLRTLDINLISQILTDNSNVNEIFGVINISGFIINKLTVIGILLFIGCMGKSAQIGLHIWLPDAMEGPTPISALIHASTMVTAGVFLLSKMSLIFEISEVARNFVLIIGSITALVSALIATSQTDIKKIIAYSTCSQLGYMFIACGVSAYSVAIFHLLTHAFFKALLFLCAGSVIHAMSGEQDIFKMGGLRKKIPMTFILFIIGSIAIAGLPPFAGYFSKDAIIEAVFFSKSKFAKFAFASSVFSAILTAFYSWRLIIKVFQGNSNKISKEVVSKIHDSSKIMLLPLVPLAFFSIFSGFIGVVLLHITNGNPLSFFGSALKTLKIAHHEHPSLGLRSLPVACSLVGILLAYFVYCTKIGGIFTGKYNLIARFLRNKLYFDEIYNIIFIRPLLAISRALRVVIDKIIDEVLPGTFSSIAMLSSSISAKINSGNSKVYFIIQFSVICLIFAYFVFNASLII